MLKQITSMTKNHLNNIFLIGFMASGKTTLGKKLSKYLGVEFIDTDKLISKEQNKTVAQIFKEEGETKFRELERNVLLSLTQNPKSRVIATGGGLPCNEINMDLMLKNGIVVFLELDLKSVFNRVKSAKNKRPLLANLSDEELKNTINNLYSQREHYYKQAHITLKALNIRSIDLKMLSTKLTDFHK